ncbi:hypothetical protein [Streptomyces mayteni]
MARGIGLLILVLGGLDVATQLIPRSATVEDLVADARREEFVVHVSTYSSPPELRARWSTGFLGTREIVEPLEGLSPEEDFVARVESAMGDEARELVTDGRDPSTDVGGLAIVVPLAYVRLVSSAWLAWGVVGCCVASLVAMMVRDNQGHRAPSAGYWLALSLLSGVGFAAYLWSEPRPLLGSGGAMSGWRVAGATAVWGGIAVVGLAVLALIRW